MMKNLSYLSPLLSMESRTHDRIRDFNAFNRLSEEQTRGMEKIL